MAVLDTAELLLQAKNYSGSGNWLDESGNGHDATVNGGPTFDGSKFTLDGTDDYFRVPDHAGLDIGSADSFVLLVLGEIRMGASSRRLFTKADSTNGYQMKLDAGTGSAQFVNADGTTTRYAPQVSLTNDVLVPIWIRRDTGADKLTIAFGAASSTSTDLTAGSLENANPLDIASGGGYLDCDIYAVVLWRSALSDSDIATAVTELTASAAFVPRAILI